MSSRILWSLLAREWLSLVGYSVGSKSVYSYGIRSFFNTISWLQSLQIFPRQTLVSVRKFHIPTAACPESLSAYPLSESNWFYLSGVVAIDLSLSRFFWPCLLLALEMLNDVLTVGLLTPWDMGSQNERWIIY
ncbi:hypothetical protein B0J14DRAFT_222287 [Halenospora varia]|nr:hypothetical protein B0J14DRAFT_222287 [Halenospora varia]